jgi:integrase
VDINKALLADLHPTVLAEFLGWLKKEERNDHQGYSDSSVGVYLSAVRNLLKFWRTYELITFSSDQENAAIEGSRTKVRKSTRSRSLVSKVPEHFSETMLRQALTIPLPSPDRRYKLLRLDRLNVLRTRAVVYTLAASALRVSDLVRLKKSDLLPARRGDTAKIISKKTGLPSEVFFHSDVLGVIDAYLNERDDISPWIFIQHGRAGKKVTLASTQAFMREEVRRGYGQRLSEHTIREIVKSVAIQVGYLEEDGSNPNELYCSPHAFRHEYANRLRQLGVPLADIQDVLGHADPSTTKNAYATKPNIPAIIAAGQSLQALPVELKNSLYMEE